MPRTKSSNHEIEKLVRINPFLYDTSKDDHKDQQEVEYAWSSIAKIMDNYDVTGKIYIN